MADESPWVRTSERLPKSDVPIFVCYLYAKDHYAIVQFFSGIDKYWADGEYWGDNDGERVETPDFWMPIPPVPADDDGK